MLGSIWTPLGGRCASWRPVTRWRSWLATSRPKGAACGSPGSTTRPPRWPPWSLDGARIASAELARKAKGVDPWIKGGGRSLDQGGVDPWINPLLIQILPVRDLSTLHPKTCRRERRGGGMDRWFESFCSSPRASSSAPTNRRRLRASSRELAPRWRASSACARSQRNGARLRVLDGPIRRWSSERSARLRSR